MDKKDLGYCPIPFGATTKEQILEYINQGVLQFEVNLELASVINMPTSWIDGSVVVGVDSAASPDTEKTVSRSLRGCMCSFQTLDDSAFQHGIDMTPPSDNQSDIP